MTDSLDRESRLVRDTHMGHVKSNNIAQAHGNFGLRRRHISKPAAWLHFGDTHAFNPVAWRSVSFGTKEECMRHSLVEAFYRSEHFDIAAGRGDEVDDDAGTRVAGSNRRCDPRRSL